MQRPLCFVLMPFGRKPGASGGTVDFDAVYRELIAPAVEAAGMAVIRADEELCGGVIHKPMFERLILCEYAVADLTTANANVFYELGLRHAVRRSSTILMFAEGFGQLPFDAAPLRALPYRLGPSGAPVEADAARAALAARLVAARDGAADSPVFQLVEGFPDIQRLKTDVFRERVRYSEQAKEQLAAARGDGIDAVRSFERELGAVADADAAVVVDLYLSYRAVEGWEEMIALAAKMSPPLAETVLVQEQLALALNRAGKGEAAERLLLELMRKRGPSSETCGILGRVRKDRWKAALKAGQAAAAAGWLKKAIEAYLKGFEADWRDAYPGVNAVTLMELSEPPDPRRAELLPVVAYAVKRRVASGEPDYWDYATLLELAVLAGDPERANAALPDALAAQREGWEGKSTADNLQLIRESRERRGGDAAWIVGLESALRAPTAAA